MDRHLLLHRLKALTSAPRLRILLELQHRRTASTRELAQVLRLSAETTFYHLSRLVSRDVVQRVRRHGDVRYRLSLHQESPSREILRLLS